VSRRPKIHVLLAELLAMSQKCGNHEAAQAYHNSLKDDPARWAQLEARGTQEYDPEFALELRNCARCGSTLARKFKISQ
jgi:hypothetical protein